MHKQKSPYIRTLTVIGIICLQLVSLQAVFADENIEEITEKDNKVPVMSETEHKQELFLIKLRQQLQTARTDYFQVDKNLDTAKERLVEVTDSIRSLKAQIENMDYLIGNTQAKIRNVTKQIAQKENTIDVLLEDIQIKKIEIENQKLLLKEYLELLYLQENNFYDESEKQNVSVSKLLLADASVGETFQEIQYFSILEQTGHNIFNRLEKAEKEYKQQRADVIRTRQKLAKLNKQLDDEKTNLKLQQNAKQKLLEQTQGEEEIYRELIAQSKKEQLQIIAEINTLKENLLFIEQKIKEDGEDFNPDKYSNLINPRIKTIYDFQTNDEFINDETLNWPVSPTRGISAYFHDSSYKATFGIPHNAIDIPVAQGTPVRAPASGVAYKIKDSDDASYAYIILAHKGGLLTVYGHMSEILIHERDIILPGEVIGLSGGIPGTKGAGYLTTGAHLHFEVIQSGKHIDPLTILPLEKLGENNLPAYLKELYTTDDTDNEKEHANNVLGDDETADQSE
ncbi:peptidoglycan DD-metalloendopeptidase family protein [Candidatus Peregrinibacteria bacterium]|nr:peptidoglycan DD-metalloendopeptidase family protein [Candidatus Peregrinibacteria bacterium]